MACLLPDIENLNIIALYTISKIGKSLQANNYMPIALGRHVVDQIDQAIFHATRAKAVYHVRNEIRHNY